MRVLIVATAWGQLLPVAGGAGRSLYFDGTSTFISVPLQCNNPTLTTYPCKPLSGFSHMTVAMWIRADSLGNFTLLDRGGSPGQQEYRMMLNSTASPFASTFFCESIHSSFFLPPSLFFLAASTSIVFTGFDAFFFACFAQTETFLKSD